MMVCHALGLEPPLGLRRASWGLRILEALAGLDAFDYIDMVVRF